MTDIIAPKQEAVLVEVREDGLVIVPQKEAVVVEAQTEAAIITPQSEAIIIEVVERGPAGKDGVDGQAGLPAGNDGDIIRYNAATGHWESRSEPFEFQGIVLIPMDLPGSPAEGFVGYNAVDNGLYVAVE